jgi:hypothetical protein
MTRTWSFQTLTAIAAACAWSVLSPARVIADPPGRVARLNFMSGAVSLRPAGADEWGPAVPNRPLTTGDQVWTDANSRAELHIGSTAIQLNSQSELDITALDDNTLQLRLAQGSVTVRVRHLDDGQVYEVDTPNGAISIARAGDYRIDAEPDGASSLVDVWDGSAEVTSAGSSFAVNAGQQASVRGTDSPTYDLVDAPERDGWDQWCANRDRRDDNSESARYVSSEMTGYEDLDAYGRWEDVGDYGHVWIPTGMGPGWAPYHTGHWVWIDPWGWTWVDDAPWGYAPYHYGRWVHLERGWGWVPGAVVARPVYAPALVAFVGAPARRPGVGVSVAIGAGAVAWFALGPHEVYHPAYAVSPTYVRQVNVTNVTNVTNITNVTNVTNVTYVNRGVPGAMMATSSTNFTSARPVQAAPIRVTQQMRMAPVMGAAPRVVPTRESLVPVRANYVVHAPPATIVNRPVMARVAPPPAPVPFAERQRALARNGGRPLAPAQVEQIRASSPRASNNNRPLFRPAAVRPSSGGSLQAAHAGLPAASHVAPSTPSGFAPKSDAPTGFAPRPNSATGVARRPNEPTTGFAPNPNQSSGGEKRVGPPTATRVNTPPPSTDTKSPPIAQPEHVPSGTVAVPHRVPTTGAPTNMTPNVTHEATPNVTHEATPNVAHPTTPNVTHNATPNVTHNATPNVTHNATPNATPNPGTPGASSSHVAGQGNQSEGGQPKAGKAQKPSGDELKGNGKASGGGESGKGGKQHPDGQKDEGRAR